MPDSSTGGFLHPVKPVETRENLEDILHDFFAGLTGLPGDMVRPKWSSDAPGLPPAGQDWCSFGIMEEGGDVIGGERHVGDGEGCSIAESHEPFSVLVSFYGRHSRTSIRTLRAGLSVKQNHEYLYKREMAFVSAGPNIHVPEIFGEVWNDRWDIHLTFRRRIVHEYQVLNIKKFDIDIRNK